MLPFVFMDVTPQKELRNHIGEVLRRVEAGENLTVPVSGRPVAELRPTGRRRWVGGAVLARVWQGTTPQEMEADLGRLDAEIVDPHGAPIVSPLWSRPSTLYSSPRKLPGRGPVSRLPSGNGEVSLGGVRSTSQSPLPRRWNTSRCWPTTLLTSRSSRTSSTYAFQHQQADEPSRLPMAHQK